MDDESTTLEATLRDLTAAQLARKVVRIEWLSAQLGLRRFARVTLAGEASPRTLIARIDAPEDPGGRPAGVPPEPPLEPIRALLEAHGLPVPRRFGGDEAKGIDLLEDVGDRSLRDAAADPAERAALYAEACDWIPQLQRIPRAEVAAFTRHLDAPLIRYKAELFTRHAVPSRGRPASGAERAAIDEAFAAIAAHCSAAPARLAHRDYQSANLHVASHAPERAATAPHRSPRRLPGAPRVRRGVPAARLVRRARRRRAQSLLLSAFAPHFRTNRMPKNSRSVSTC